MTQESRWLIIMVNSYKFDKGVSNIRPIFIT